MVKMAQNKIKKAQSRKTDAPFNRPKGPISKVEMEKALCNNGTYDVLEQWDKDIYFFAEGSDVTDAIRSINEKVVEDIFYSKLFVMELLAANAKTIDPGLLDRMVMLYCDNFLALRMASVHFHWSERIELNAITNGLYVQLKKAGKDPGAFLKQIVKTIPEDEWGRSYDASDKERPTIPFLVAMKALEDDITDAEWPFFQGLGPGYDAKLIQKEQTLREDFKFALNRALDRNGTFSDTMVAHLPYLASLGKTVSDPDVLDDVLFWLTSRFIEVLTGNLSMNDSMKKDLFNTMMGISKSLRPQCQVADRFPSRMWELLAEAMNGQSMSQELKGFFTCVMKDDDSQGQNAQSLEKEIETQLGTLGTSTAPNERFFAVDRLLTILSVNIVPVAPHIRDKAFDGALVELGKEPDRLVRNALINLVLAAGGDKQVKALVGVLKAHLDDPSWKDISETAVATENFGQPGYKDFPTRTFAMVTLVSKGITMEKDEELLALSERLLPEDDPDIKCLCFGYLLAVTDGDRFKDVVLELMRSTIPYRAFVGPSSHELLGPGQIPGGVEFEVKPSEVDALISFLRSKYKDCSPDAKARLRFILLQMPSNDLLPLLVEDYRYHEEDRESNIRRYWLQLNFLGTDIPPGKETIPEKDQIFVRAYTQARTEAVFDDPYARDRIHLVDLPKIMKAMGLKVPLKRLLGAVTNGYLSFNDIEPFLDFLSEGDWDIFLNETVNLFNSTKDGEEYKLTTVLSTFCPYVRKKFPDWYNSKWESILHQLVLPRSWDYSFAQYWTADDKEMLLFWLKEDPQSDYWPLYIRLMWLVADKKYIIKKAVPLIVKNWRDQGLEAMNDLDRLEEPLDIVSRDEALATLYDQAWKKAPESKKAIMERWWSTEHMADTLKNRKKARKGEIFEPEHIIKAGVLGLSEALLKWYQQSRLDLSKPMAGSGPLVEVLKRIMTEDTSDEPMISSLALFCSIAGGMGAFMELAVPFTQRWKEVHMSGRIDLSQDRFFNYSNDPSDSTFPTLLIKAIELGHQDALKCLIELIDSGITNKIEDLAGPDFTYGPLMDIVARGVRDPVSVGKMLKDHSEMQLAFIIRLRKGKGVLTGTAKRPKPEDFGANAIIYDL